ALAEAGREEEDASRFLTITRRGGRKALKVSNWVGVLAVGEHVIEVLPKPAANREEGRQMLLAMLRTAYPGAFRLFTEHGFSPEKMPLYEAFMQLFVESVEHVVRRGLRHDYVEVEENRRYFAGRLLVAPHIRINRGLHHKVYTAHDEFIADWPANRLLRAGLELVLRRSGGDVQRRARQLVFAFQDVPPSRNVDADIRRLRVDRMMQHYEPALSWARWLLKGLGPFAPDEGARVRSVLFPMERVFQHYVGFLLRLKIGNLELEPSRRLLKSTHRYMMRPDYRFKHNGSQMIGDAKWKLLDAGSIKIRQADLYQLYAYGRMCLNGGERRLFLFYPETGGMPGEEYEYNDDTALKLRIVPTPLPKGQSFNFRDLANNLFQRMGLSI
ncbi:MAG: hypothetical protein D6771_08015, partial [Zetaproteobacteria bacterium]